MKKTTEREVWFYVGAVLFGMQNHYNLVYREEEREMIPLCLDQGIGLIPWSPMARGFFAANRARGGGGETVRVKTDLLANQLYFRQEDFSVADRAWEVAKPRSVTASQIALAWLLNKPHITAPIVGADTLRIPTDRSRPSGAQSPASNSARRPSTASG